MVAELGAAGARWDADEAVTALYSEHYRSLVRLSALLLRDSMQAEEVVQDAFVAMHGAWRRIQDQDKALAYLRQTVVNRSRSVLRRRVVADKYAPTPGPDMPTLPGDVAVRGDTLYNTYCATCHGVTGAGNGRVASRFVGVPSLLTDRARGYTDGYLYSIIRYGRGLMPKYGDKLPSPRDRWAIVNHLRALQGRPPAVATTGGAN